MEQQLPNNIQILNIDPQPKPRMTRSDKWRKRPIIVRYYDYCNMLRELGAKLPEAGAKVTFNIPIPKSWSKKKQNEMIGKPHQQRPDLDNMLKALSDAVHDEDAHIWQITVAKYWAITGSIVIESASITSQ
ncbi:MAG: RusA family crossover junction endodeoxyribonuclease [Bacteroidetes bacterium HGW-Bacteroidetes-1]|nr:MAG: RusA family crossover junction endodeoxyribonuclease [Bacteroidetes bacterium HGW-Bacteroidetes-1]